MGISSRNVARYLGWVLPVFTLFISAAHASGTPAKTTTAGAVLAPFYVPSPPVSWSVTGAKPGLNATPADTVVFSTRVWRLSDGVTPTDFVLVANATGHGIVNFSADGFVASARVDNDAPAPVVLTSSVPWAVPWTLAQVSVEQIPDAGETLTLDSPNLSVSQPLQ